MQTRFNEQDPAPSPDGGWVAYVSDESGRDEVYVQAFPDPSVRTQVSSGGGRRQLSFLLAPVLRCPDKQHT